MWIFLKMGEVATLGGGGALEYFISMVMAYLRVLVVVMLRMKTSSMPPPRPRVDLRRMAESGPSTLQFSAKTWRMKAEVSEPMVTAPWPPFMVQLRMVM